MPISVRALFFAAYRDLLGQAAMDVEIPTGSSVADLVLQLRQQGHPFSALPEAPAVAVNRTYAPLEETLRAGDEVAFIPPVAGG